MKMGALYLDPRQELYADPLNESSGGNWHPSKHSLFVCQFTKVNAIRMGKEESNYPEMERSKGTARVSKI